MIHIIRPCFYLFIIISPLISCSEDLPKIKKDQKKEEVIDLFNTEKIFHDGFEREYILFIPESYDVNSKFPLMLNFHAYSGTASGHVYISDMRSISNLENFILVYPQGLGNVWNPSLNFDNYSKNKTDDFGFIEAVIREISSNYKIDTSRVYATGFSNGAGMAHALACVLNNKIAAIASMSGLLYKHTAEKFKP